MKKDNYFVILFIHLHQYVYQPFFKDKIFPSINPVHFQTISIGSFSYIIAFVTSIIFCSITYSNPSSLAKLFLQFSSISSFLIGIILSKINPK